MSLTADYTLLLPEVAWEFEESTPHLSGEGWQQLAVLPYGKGKLVLSGEAAMFSAQISGGGQNKMGMNSPSAPNNLAFLRRIIAWLAR